MTDSAAALAYVEAHLDQSLDRLFALLGEGVRGLLPQGRTIDQEQNAAEALGLEQTVDEGNAGLGLASAGGHGEQNSALTLLDAGLGGKDGFLLVGPQWKAVIEWRIGEFGVRAVVVTLQQGAQPFRRVPAFERVA